MADEVVGRRSALKLGGFAAIGAVGAGAAMLAPQVASAAGPLSYNTITPFRSVATPSFGLPKLRSGEADDWDLWTDINGNAQIPSNIQAVTYNLTITQTEGAAFLAILPAGAVYAGISNINWTARNVDLANGGTVGVGFSGTSGAGSCTVFCGGAASATHYIIDITGYFI